MARWEMYLTHTRSHIFFRRLLVERKIFSAPPPKQDEKMEEDERIEFRIETFTKNSTNREVVSATKCIETDSVIAAAAAHIVKYLLDFMCMNDTMHGPAAISNQMQQLLCRC